MDILYRFFRPKVTRIKGQLAGKIWMDFDRVLLKPLCVSVAVNLTRKLFGRSVGLKYLCVGLNSADGDDPSPKSHS